MAKKKGNIENLKVLTSEQARDYGRKGGLKSAEVRERKRNLQERIVALLEAKNQAKEIAASIAEELGIEVADHLDIVVAAMYKKAIEGDVKAAEKLLEYGKFADPQTVEVTNAVKNVIEINGVNFEI
ncbi:MAG: hypothetical protein SNG97_06930 [Rikenellaceae bacterium]